MSYLRKAFASIIIRIVSAGAGFAVEISNLINFEAIELFLILATAIAIVATIYSDRLKKIFPCWLIVKSGFDSVYILTLGKADFTSGLIIAANIVLIMVYVSDIIVSKALTYKAPGVLTQAAFTVCFLIPCIAVLLSLAMITLGVLIYKMSVFALIISLIVTVCVFFKVSMMFVNLMILTLKKRTL